MGLHSFQWLPDAEGREVVHMKISKDTKSKIFLRKKDLYHNRMKTYEAVITCTTRITGRNEEEARKALKEWLTTNEENWILQSFYLIEDPAW